MLRTSRVAFTITALALVATTAAAAECPEAIDASTAQHVFDALKAIDREDDCVLDGVATDRSEMRITWKKGNRALAPVVVVPSSCDPASRFSRSKLTATIPAELAGACPSKARATRDAIESEKTPTLVQIGAVPQDREAAPSDDGNREHVRRWTRRAPAIAFGAGALALIAAAILAIRRWRPHRAIAARIARIGASRAGWGAALLVGPHLALGTWLLVVPDHLAFTTAQVVTLVHVGAAFVTFPIVGVWLFVHVRRMRAARPAGGGAGVVKWTLTAATIVAAITGYLVTLGGTIVRPAGLHAWCGVAVGVPLAVHLWSSSRRRAAAAALALLVLATAGGAAARRWLPPAPVDAVVPEFAYATRPADLYEPAANCGECHTQHYDDWRRSTHARTLELPQVRESMGRSKDLLGEDLAHIGQLLADKDKPLSAALVFGSCGSCHAPTSFYGDGHPPLPEAPGVAGEGVGCSFCHTLREVHRSRDAARRLDPGTLSRDDIFAVMSRAPFYVSAPETVRRYIGQGSSSRFARAIANYLIRWRPQIHARDYHSPVLDDSRACMACHSLGLDLRDVPHMTYFGWESSAYNTGDPKTSVSCQDCHMVRHMTGRRASEEGKQVPWGPDRPDARSHLFLGGNVAAATTLHDEALAKLQHDFHEQAASIELTRAERTGDRIDVTASVRADTIGHYFPALETKLRYAWIELRALDARGEVVASTPKPKDSENFGSASPIITASVDDPKPDNQRLVAPKNARAFDAHLALAPGTDVQTIVAELFTSLDPAPIAKATRTISAPPK